MAGLDPAIHGRPVRGFGNWLRSAVSRLERRTRSRFDTKSTKAAKCHRLFSSQAQSKRALSLATLGTFATFVLFVSNFFKRYIHPAL